MGLILFARLKEGKEGKKKKFRLTYKKGPQEPKRTKPATTQSDVGPDKLNDRPITRDWRVPNHCPVSSWRPYVFPTHRRMFIGHEIAQRARLFQRIQRASVRPRFYHPPGGPDKSGPPATLQPRTAHIPVLKTAKVQAFSHSTGRHVFVWTQGASPIW